jgi:hypothetical protein
MLSREEERKMRMRIKQGKWEVPRGELCILVLPSGEEKIARKVGDKFYIGDNEVRCGCTGKTKETSSPFTWDKENNKLVCSNCGKEVRIKEKEEEPLRLVPAGMTEDFGRVWALNRRIPREDWAKVAKYFFHAGPREELGLEADERDLGWVTANPDAVEQALGIPPERSWREFEKQEEEARKKIMEIKRRMAEEKAALELLYSPSWIDMSWDDYSYEVGKKVYETEHYTVHEYFAGGKFVGYTIKSKYREF